MTAPDQPTPEKLQTDWERIELDYRAGILSVREIADARGVSHTAIGKRAKKEGWSRDLKAKIQAKADALVAKREVAKEVAKERLETEKVIVEANAEVVARIRMDHRRDIARSRSLSMSLLQELENCTFSQDLFEELGELIIGPPIFGDDPSDKAAERRRQKLQDAFDKALSLPSRVDSMKKLSESLRVLVTMEREAYSIATESAEGGDLPPPSRITYQARDASKA